MAATEGQTVDIHTRGFDKDGLLGGFMSSGSDAPATIGDVERIVLAVQQCFAKFTQDQLTYAAAVSDAPASEQTIEQLASGVADASRGGSSAAVQVKAVEGRMDDLMEKINAIGENVAKASVASDTVEKLKKPLGMLEQLARGPGLVGNIIKLALKEALISLLSSPSLIFAAVLLGSMAYKFLIEPHIETFKAWWGPVGTALDTAVKYWKEMYEEYVKPALVACKPYLEEAWKFWQEYGRKVVDFWKDFDLKREWDNIVGFGAQIWDDVKKKASEAWDAVASIPGKIADGVSDAWDSVKYMFEDVVDRVKEFFNRVVVGIRKALSVLPGFASKEEINADVIKRLDEEGKKLVAEKEALAKMYKEAKTDKERDDVMKKTARVDEKLDRLQSKVKDYGLSDKEVEDAKKLLQEKNKGGDVGSEFTKAYDANKVGGKLSDGGKLAMDAPAAQSGLFDDANALKVAVDAKGNKEVRLTAEQNREFEERIQRVFAKNIEGLRAASEKKGEKFDEAEAIRQLGERVMGGIEELSRKSDAVAKGQITDADLRKALSLSTRQGKMEGVRGKTTVVVKDSGGTPQRSM